MSSARAGFKVAAPSAAPARGSGDLVLFAAIAMLLVLGALLVYTASAAVSLDRFGTPHHFVVRHLGHLVMGAIVLAVLWRCDYKQLDRPALVHALWLVIVVLLTVTLFEAPAGGARRWLRLGGLSVQVSEVAKLLVVLAAALHLSRGAAKPEDGKRSLLVPLILTFQLAGLVALQPDFGTAASLLALFALAAFVVGTKLMRLAAIGGTGVGIALLYLVQEPYRVVRLRTFLDPLADPLGAGFQLRQSLIALGTGGLFGRTSEGLLGTGLGCSVQKLFFLPEPHTDFVFAVLGEELGLVGTVFACLLFALVLVRGLLVAGRASTLFGTLVATGATAMIAFQAFVNMMVVVGLLPTKGIPLPFLSAGGSSLVVSCAAAGLLLSVSRDGT